MYLVSACLLGLKSRYDGGSNRGSRNPVLPNTLLVPFCPEQLGGLPTPRSPAEIIGGSGEDVLAGKGIVCNERGEDVTALFLRGAYESLYLARFYGAEGVFLKDGSPSCGVNCIHDGTFSGCKRAGMGVTAALLQQHRYTLFSEREFFRDR
ncbi:MAG: DUF523 domain-containing protein [Bacillota bacterium]